VLLRIFFFVVPLLKGCGSGSGSAIFLEAGSGSASEWKAWFGSTLKSKSRSFRAKTLAVDAGDGPLEGLYTIVVADSQHLDEEQDQDPHYSEKLDPDRGIEIKSWIRIRTPDYFIISTTDVFL
jgi:hypothetical protein